MHVWLGFPSWVFMGMVSWWSVVPAMVVEELLAPEDTGFGAKHWLENLLGWLWGEDG